MIATVLLPTRKRPLKLRRSLESIYASTDPSVPIEVVLRVHRSDKTTIDSLGNLPTASHVTLRTILGNDHNGYTSLPLFYKECIDVAQGDWVWHFGDDMQVLGFGWNRLLLDIPLEGFLVQPEIHRLNVSEYLHHADGPAPIHPRLALGDLLDLMTKFGSTNIDIQVHDYLIRERGWEVYYLPGITLWHDWEGVNSHVA